ncbi:hypothetical protein, partial [Collimonas humicola]|uniref:hypothetical protein n=1 Tax=Collimonas humicola TaxID=2825886 RepID=UPI001B8C2A68
YSLHPLQPAYFPQTSRPIQHQFLAAVSLLSRRSQREANYSNTTSSPQVLLTKFFKIFRFI